MRKLTTILLAGIATLTFTACGGGSSSNGDNPPTPTIDNSVLADGTNDYGYYGNEVIFGEDIAVGLWHGSATINNKPVSNYIRLYDDGFDSDGLLWGVSQNGQQLSFSDGEIDNIVSSLGNSCYKVNAKTSNGQNISGEICKIEDTSSVK